MRFPNFFTHVFLTSLLFTGLSGATTLQADPAAENLQWSQAEISRIAQMSFQHIPQYSSDPSNKYLYNPAAIKLGKALFHDKRLSSDQSVACASCHIRQKAFADQRTIALGKRIGVRNTPSLYNVAQQNWFFWDGRKDSLWAQALAPLENPAEHAFSRLQVVHFIASDKHYRKQYQAIFPEALPGSEALASLPGKGGPEASIDALIAWKKLPQKLKHDVNRLFSNIGKSIAAYVATIKSKPSQFDRFAAEIQKKAKSDILDKSAQRGLKLFLGRANCANCHSGALFSNKEFHNIGTGIPGKDNGRAEVINQVRHDIFNCLGEYSDAKPAQCMELTYMGSNSHALSGAYRTPSLRNVAKTAPYMHDGRFKTLDDVLAYYASIDNKKALETDLPPMKLSKRDQQDIIRFLQSL